MKSAGSMAGVWLSPDILLALGVVIILLFMLVPIPPVLVDIGLAVSIMFSVVILMTALFVQKPIEFTSFPTILLIATSLRLGLNIATTRLILSDGHEGTDSAGQIVKAFGEFMIGDNFIVGTIVFAILVLVNFIVITKGSGRIAEVAARFALDAMPGKQMAIDSDMSAGLIGEDEARKRRSELASESSFYGSMDGAAKFVRGDAIAGLLIVFINIIAGIVIGVSSHGLTMAEAANVYTVLTIGDGLVSQIPSLVISVAAGLVVAKAGMDGATDKAVSEQFSRYPQAMGMTGGMMLAMAFLPGMPAIPFLVLGGGMAGLAYLATKKIKVEALRVQAEDTAKTKAAHPTEEPISKTLAMDIIRLELGYGLLSLVQGDNSPRITDQIKGLRRQLAEDMGYVLPSVRIQDNLQLPANTYVVRIKEIEAGRGDVRPGMYLCMDPTGQPISLPGEMTVEPTFGLPAMWIEDRYREDATFKGLTVVDATTVVTTHITEIVKDNMSDLISYAETQKLLDELPKDYQKLIADTIPAQITVGGLQRILQNLVTERVSIRDLPTILEGISEIAPLTRNPSVVTEHVRTRLARQLCDQNVNVHGFVPLAPLSSRWEQAFQESLLGDGEEKQLAMAPSLLQEFIATVRDKFDEFGSKGEVPVMLTSPVIRPYVRSVIERFRPQTIVMSQNEIHPKARIKTVGQI